MAPTVPFDHEKLDAYAASLDFLALAHEIIREFPRGRSSLADQLERAAMSTTLNIAEGSGEFSKKEKVRFYRMALRSAAECAALLDVAQRLGIATSAKCEKRKGTLHRVTAMLLGLVRHHGAT